MDWMWPQLGPGPAWLCQLTLAAYTLVLSLMGVQSALLLGPLAGVLEFVPVVGPAVAALSVFVIATLTSYPHLIWLFLFLGAWRLIEDYVNEPRIMGKSSKFPLWLRSSQFLAGGEIGGDIGALVSVPVLATLRILWRRMSSLQGSDILAVRTVPTDGAKP